MHRLVVLLLAIGVVAAAGWPSPGLVAQTVARPRAELRESPLLELSGAVDSNSPAIWDRVAGRNTLFVMTSFAGQPSTAAGRSLTQLGAAEPILLDPWPGGGIWMEAVVTDVDGTWYGYYHNEISAPMCAGDKVIPRIGAARSRDQGRTWEPLGVILEAPPRSYDCSTSNQYFFGGVGDLSVQLDAASRDLHIFYSLYLRAPRAQGVGVARLAWADRDEPAGKVAIWRNGAWIPTTAAGPNRNLWVYPSATPLFPTGESWHDDDTLVDAYWGPSVHWNTYLQQYVMLLNRASNEAFRQEGIYVSYAPSLENPDAWTPPVNLLKGGQWYPQVIGLESGTGTDKTAGEYARFFMSGASRHVIRFIR